MPLYIDPDLITDETAVAEAILAGMADRLDSALDLPEEEGWEPNEGSPETAYAEATGIITATIAALVQDDERDDYEGFGSLILHVDRIAAEPAVGFSKWSFNEAGTFLIPDGSELVIDGPDGNPVGFATVGDVTVTGNEATDVRIVALEPGANGNGLSGPTRDWEPLPFVTGVQITTTTSGGTDEEDRDSYLDRVVRAASRLKDVPIVTDDYADAALDVPGVARAVAVRLLDLDHPTTPPAAAGHVTVFVADADGNEPPPEVLDEVIATMMGDDRPLAVIVHADGPSYTNVSLRVDFRLEIGADHDATVAAVQSALLAAFDKSVYGVDDNAPGRWRPPASTAEAVITEYDVAAAVDDVDGLKAVVVAQVNGTDSVALTGWAPLPNVMGTSVNVVP